MIAATSADGRGSPLHAHSERALHLLWGDVLEQPEEADDARDEPSSADAPEAVLAPESPAEETPAPDAPPKRRRGRTTALIAAAAVLGGVAGTCTGYLVQADRAPTPLPPLSQPVLAQAEGEAPEPLSAKQDRRVRTDGDLRTLLLKKPRGAKETDWAAGVDGWASLAVYAGYYEDPGDAFGELLAGEFRRTAESSWEADGYFVEIRLTQYRQEAKLAAADDVDTASRWAEGRTTRDWAIPGTGDGRVYMMKRETEPGFEPIHRASARAWRGDVAMTVWVSGLEPVPRKLVMDLAERQMERL